MQVGDGAAHPGNDVMDEKLMSGGQHVFTTRKSCLSSWRNFYDEVPDMLGEGKAVNIVYLDFSETLDPASY